MAGVLLFCEGSKDDEGFGDAEVERDSDLGAVWQPARARKASSKSDGTFTFLLCPGGFLPPRLDTSNEQ
jgi:hypothetical protein